MDPLFRVQGATLTDMTDPDSLPTDPADPRLVDQDGDGQPGFTITLQGAVDGSAYVAQWSRVELDGRPVAADRIEGLVTFDARQNVVASEPAFIANMVSQPIPDTDRCVSYFVLARITADTDCTAINAQSATLFPGMPTGG